MGLRHARQAFKLQVWCGATIRLRLPSERVDLYCNPLILDFTARMVMIDLKENIAMSNYKSLVILLRYISRGRMHIALLVIL